MASSSFDTLSTEQFRKRMRAHAVTIYEWLFPGCKVVDLRKDGEPVHILDKEFGIDTLAVFKSGQWITIQEKYRTHRFLIDASRRVQPDCPDFTQEYMNAAGTQHESPGEWFKLGAQLYFYGWSNADESGFEKWVLLDIPQYKLLVERAGGLGGIGKMYGNRAHGRATFFAIPIFSLKPAWVATHKGWVDKTHPFFNGG